MRKLKWAALSVALCANVALAQQPSATIGEEWRGYVDALDPIGERLAGLLPHPEDVQLRRELYRGLFAGIAVGYIGLLNSDARHPDFFPYTTQALNALGNNPDTDYYIAPLEDTGVYKLSGYRGTVKRIDFQIGAGKFIPRGEVDEHFLGRALANYDIDDDAHLKKDGAFEVILSAERPKDWKGDWWKLGKGATNVMVRQISYDWLREVDGRLAIERLDTPAVKPRPSAETLDADLKQIPKWVESTVKMSATFAKGIREQQGVNKVAYKDLTQYAGHLTQKYAYGGFDLAPDEALIVEAKVPKQCRYWSIHLLDDLGYIVDWMNRQSSINGYTGKIDKDGVFRAVISAQDLGVPNWLDTAGYKTGAIQVRWEKCNEYPEHTAKVVETAEVRQHLPASTPTVTAAARDADIRQRRKGAQMRKRW